MPGDQRIAAPQQNRRVAVMHSLDLQDRRRRQIVQEHSPLDLRLNDGVVHVVSKVGVGTEHIVKRSQKFTPKRRLPVEGNKAKKEL